MNDLIHLCIIFRLCCSYSVSQDIYDWDNQNENMDLEQNTVHHAKWKGFFSREQTILSCHGCFGVSVQDTSILL